MNDVTANDWNQVGWENIEQDRGYRRAKKVINFISKDGKHLDVGTGNGDGTYLFSKKKETYGLEFGPASANIAKKKGLKIIQGDARHMPLKDSSFRSISCLDVIEHIPNPKLAMEEISRVIKPGGEFLLQTPTKEIFKERVLKFIRRFNLKKQVQPYDVPLAKKEIINLLKKNDFEIIEIKKLRNWTPNPIIYYFSFSILFYCKKIVKN
jgi:ubiquinone/menaquinone biosynthesis C-methylase UbiE